MAKEFSRTQRLQQLMQRELAVILQREVKDPRLGMITVSDVEITQDLAYGKVYVTILGDDTVIETNIRLLNQMAGYLRTALSKRVKARTIPQLTFIYDKSLAEGNRMAKLIDDVVAEDEKRHKDDN